MGRAAEKTESIKEETSSGFLEGDDKSSVPTAELKTIEAAGWRERCPRFFRAPCSGLDTSQVVLYFILIRVLYEQ